MWKITIIGQASSLNLTIQDILNQQPDYSCEILHFRAFDKSDITGLIRKVDILIADLATNHSSPIFQIEAIRNIFPTTPILIIHFLDHSSIQNDLLEAGANMILTADLSEDNLIQAMQKLLSE